MIHSIMTFLTRKKVHKGNNLKLDLLAANAAGTSEAIMQPVHSIQEIKEKYPDCDGILLKGVVRAAQKEVEFTDGFDTPKFEMVIFSLLMFLCRVWTTKAKNKIINLWYYF